MTVTADDVVPPPATIPEHPAHHSGHRLIKRVAHELDRFFLCDGCMEHGAGTGYRCEHERCNFDLHTCCAVAPDTLTHQAFPGCVFLFLREPPPPATAAIEGGKKRATRACVACGEDVRGFVYHCFDDDTDIHPCCARRPEHAIVLNNPLSRGKEDENRGPESIHRPAAARHRRWVPGAGRQAGGQGVPQDPRVPLRSSDTTSDDGNSGRERLASAARNRRWWWKR